MKTFYYSIYDAVAEEFGPLFPAKNDKVAVRHFSQLISSAENKDDYSLHCICEVDQESGQLSLPFESYEVGLTDTVVLEESK